MVHFTIELGRQILGINKHLLELIESQTGVVSNIELQDLLGKFGAHIRILQLAYEHKLQGPAEIFLDVVYPRAIDGAVESAIRKLQDKNKVLGDLIDERMKNNKKENRNSTITYYDKFSREYAARTMNTDVCEFMKGFYKEFTKHMMMGNRILDAGCGPGRDTRFFIESGYTVVSIDPSAEMARLCNEYPHSYCLQVGFGDINFVEEFDGVWACASILHLSFEDAKKAISKLATALKPGGVIYISLKEGKGASIDEDGRYFCLYDKRTADKLLEVENRLEKIGDWWSNSALLSTPKQSVSFLNIILRRKKL